jgi:hypothetical protein
MIDKDTDQEITPTVRVIQLGDEKFVSWDSVRDLLGAVRRTPEADDEMSDWADAECLLLLFHLLEHVPVKSGSGELTQTQPSVLKVLALAALEANIELHYSYFPSEAAF